MSAIGKGCGRHIIPAYLSFVPRPRREDEKADLTGKRTAHDDDEEDQVHETFDYSDRPLEALSGDDATVTGHGHKHIPGIVVHPSEENNRIHFYVYIHKLTVHVSRIIVYYASCSSFVEIPVVYS